jgi:hypothetical protein
MSMMNLNKIAETIAQPVFYLHGVPYLPDYSDKHRWVSPGAKNTRTVYKTTELIDAGARLSVMSLWARSWTEEVKGWRAL